MENHIFKPIQLQHVNNHRGSRQQHKAAGSNSFSLHFQQAITINNKLVISKHAQERLDQRGIQINDLRWKRIEEKVNEAKKKGVNDSLVLLNDAALIVSTKNNTVITAMSRQESEAQIFTNINGTIILD